MPQFLASIQGHRQTTAVFYQTVKTWKEFLLRYARWCGMFASMLDELFPKKFWHRVALFEPGKGSASKAVER